MEPWFKSLSLCLLTCPSHFPPFMDFDAAWCPVCDRQIIPKRIQVPVPPPPPPPPLPTSQSREYPFSCFFPDPLLTFPKLSFENQKVAQSSEHHRAIPMPVPNHSQMLR